MDNGNSKGRWRWVVSGALVVGALGAALFGVFDVCEETAVSTNAGVEVVVLCQEASLLDPRYLLLLVIGAMVIWPEISEFSLGPFSIKRRLETAEAEQRELRGRVEGLTQVIGMSQTTVVQVEPSYVDPVELRNESAALGLPVAPTAGTSRAETVVDILRKYERVRVFDVRSGDVPDSLDFISATGPTEGALLWAGRVAELWPEAFGLGASMSAEQARVFSSNFPDMLDGVRAVRNALAHGKHVADEDLQATHSIVSGLERFLLDRFEHWRSLDQGQNIGPRIGSAVSDRPV